MRSPETFSGLWIRMANTGRTAQMEPLLLREDEALAALGIGRTTLWRLISTGELVSVRIGRARRYPASVVREWVEKQIECEEGRRKEAGRAHAERVEAVSR